MVACVQENKTSAFPSYMSQPELKVKILNLRHQGASVSLLCIQNLKKILLPRQSTLHLHFIFLTFLFHLLAHNCILLTV